MLQKYKVQEADIQNTKDTSVELFYDNFNRKHDFGLKYDWLYVNNPSGESHIYHMTEMSDENVIGFQCISGRTFTNGTLNISAGLYTNFAVDKKHRSLGPGLFLMKEVNKQSLNHYDILFGFPNKNSLPIFKRAGYDLSSQITRLNKPLRTSYIIKKYKSRYFPIFTGFFLDLAIRSYDYLTFLLLGNNIEFQYIERFTDEHDQLWQDVVSNNSIIMCKRDKDYLNWRFTENKDRDYKIINARSRKSDKLIGYIVCYFKENHCYIVDLLCCNFNREIKPLLSAFINNVKKSKPYSISLEYHGSLPAFKNLRSLGFFERDSNPVIFTLNPNLNYELDVSEFFLVSSDRDAI